MSSRRVVTIVVVGVVTTVLALALALALAWVAEPSYLRG